MTIAYEKYEKFWKDIKHKISIIASLDGNRDLIDENDDSFIEKITRKVKGKGERIMVDGARGYGYRIFPVVSEKHIIEFEEKNTIKLPLSYRAYLQHFGAGGIGPGRGIHNFMERVFHNNVSVPFSMEKPKDLKVIEYDDDNHPVNEIDHVTGVGVAPINHYGASDGFLVLNGPMQGEMFAWNFDDHVFFRGAFDSYYENWVDDVLEQLNNYHNFKKIKIGMTLNQAEALMEQKSEPIIIKENGDLRVTFKKTDGHLCIDPNSKVQSLYISNYYLI